MHPSSDFLVNLALILGVAAVTTVVFQRLRQPVVLGYLLAGLIVGPHTPIPVIADATMVQTLAELGVILLLFRIGLEFDLRTLFRVGPTAGLIGLFETGAMGALGYAVGRLFGWPVTTAVFAGAMVAISSTTIVAKAFEEHPVEPRLRETVFGILIVEDLLAVLALAGLAAYTSAHGLTAALLTATVFRLILFLAVVAAIGLLIIPRLVRLVVRLDRAETTLVASIGFCFGLAVLARAWGYSVALGAFLAGFLVAESGAGRRVEVLVRPVRDMFAAIFFIAVGMQIVPADLVRQWPAVLAFTAVVVAGKILGVGLGTFLTGSGTRLAVAAGMSLAQIGEFSFIIVGLAATVGGAAARLAPIAVAVSALTTLFTPHLIRRAAGAAAWLDGALPGPVQTFLSLYGTWIERLRRAGPAASAWGGVRRRFGLLVTDAVAVAIIVPIFAYFYDRLGALAAAQLGLAPDWAHWLVAATGVVVVIPFIRAMFTCARAIAAEVALRVLPAPPADRVDLAAAPRRMLGFTLQGGLLLAVGAPLAAVLQVFLPALPVATLAVIGLGALAVGFWRDAAELHGHVRACAQLVAEAIVRQSYSLSASPDPLPAPLRDLLPGLGEPVTVRLAAGSPAAGQTLGELDLRAKTGAAVLTIRRGGSDVLLPTGIDRLVADDLLTLTGTDEGVRLAVRLLTGAR